MKDRDQRRRQRTAGNPNGSSRCFTFASSLFLLLPLPVCYPADLKSACRAAHVQASALLAQDRLNDAIGLLSKTLEGLGDSPDDKLCSGETHANIANARLRRGELSAAQKAALTSVARLEEMAGTNSHALLDPLGVLANIDMLRGRFREASELIGRMERLPGNSHRDSATVEGLRGLLLMREGRYREAEENLRAALAERELAGQEGAPEATPELWNLGGLYLDHGRPAEAIILFKRCLHISEAPPRSPATELASVLGLGMSYAKAGNREMATKSFDRAVDLADSLPPNAQPSLGLAIYYRYSRFLHRTGQNKSAKEIDEKGQRLYGEGWAGTTVNIDSLFPESRKH